MLRHQERGGAGALSAAVAEPLGLRGGGIEVGPSLTNPLLLGAPR